MRNPLHVQLLITFLVSQLFLANITANAKGKPSSCEKWNNFTMKEVNQQPKKLEKSLFFNCINAIQRRNSRVEYNILRALVTGDIKKKKILVEKALGTAPNDPLVLYFALANTSHLWKKEPMPSTDTLAIAAKLSGANPSNAYFSLYQGTLYDRAKKLQGGEKLFMMSSLKTKEFETPFHLALRRLTKALSEDDLLTGPTGIILIDAFAKFPYFPPTWLVTHVSRMKPVFMEDIGDKKKRLKLFASMESMGDQMMKTSEMGPSKYGIFRNQLLTWLIGHTIVKKALEGRLETAKETGDNPTLVHVKNRLGQHAKMREKHRNASKSLRDSQMVKEALKQNDWDAFRKTVAWKDFTYYSTK